MHPDRLDALSRSLANSSSRRSVLRLFGLGVAGTAVTAVGLNQVRAKKKKGGGGQNVGPVDTLIGIPLSTRENGRRFRGRLTVLGFEEQGNDIVALAQLTGRVTKPNGKGSKQISRNLRVPVVLPSGPGAEGAPCEILELFLGPIDLTLLGLRLQVNQIHIRLTGEPGGLLGELLCELAGLLSGGGLLSEIVGLLNDILEALEDLLPQ